MSIHCEHITDQAATEDAQRCPARARRAVLAGAPPQILELLVEVLLAPTGLGSGPRVVSRRSVAVVLPPAFCSSVPVLVCEVAFARMRHPRQLSTSRVLLISSLVVAAMLRFGVEDHNSDADIDTLTASNDYLLSACNAFQSKLDAVYQECCSLSAQFSSQARSLNQPSLSESG